MSIHIIPAAPGFTLRTPNKPDQHILAWVCYLDGTVRPLTLAGAPLTQDNFTVLDPHGQKVER